MEKPTVILATSNGIGMGHLTRASAIAAELKSFANPIIISMASGVVEVPKLLMLVLSMCLVEIENGWADLSGIDIYEIELWL